MTVNEYHLNDAIVGGGYICSVSTEIRSVLSHTTVTVPHSFVGLAEEAHLSGGAAPE
jgi:hypothetical protein